MSTDFENRNRFEGDDVRYYPVCGCWPVSRTPFGVSIFGSILVVVGGFWLLTRLELLPRLVEESLGPIVVILIGIAYLINSFSLKR